MKKIIITLTNLLLITSVWSQNTLTGAFTSLANEQIKLIGYKGLKSYAVDSAQANEKGEFMLYYSEDDYGMGYLSAERDKPFFVILNDKRIRLKGESFASTESIVIIEGDEKHLFGQ